MYLDHFNILRENIFGFILKINGAMSKLIVPKSIDLGLILTRMFRIGPFKVPIWIARIFCLPWGNTMNAWHNKQH